MTECDTDSDNLTTIIASATARQPQRVIIGEGDDEDDVQASGAWVAAAELVEVER